MNKLARLPRFVVLALLCGSAAHAATEAPKAGSGGKAAAPPPAAAAKPLPGSEGLEQKLRALESKAADAKGKLPPLVQELQKHNPESRRVQGEVSKLMSALGVHLRQATAASAKLQPPTKAQGSASARPVSTASRETAQREYQAALDTGARLKTQFQAADAVAVKLKECATRATALVSAADAVSQELAVAKRELRSSSDAATRRELERRMGPWIRALESESRGIRSTALAVRSKTGLATPKAFEITQAKTAKNLSELDAGMKMVSERLEQLRAPAAPAASPAAPSTATAASAAAAPTGKAAVLPVGSWTLLYASDGPDAALPELRLKPGEDAALFKRFMGKKFLSSNDSCADKWSPGNGDLAQARAAGQFAPTLLAVMEGGFTRPGAKERLLAFNLGECNAPRAIGGTLRYVILEGDRTVADLMESGTLVREVSAVPDVNTDGVLEVVLVSAFGMGGQNTTSASLVSFAGGKSRDLQVLGESGDSCGASEDGDITSVQVFVRPGPKPEFRTEESTTKCN